MLDILIRGGTVVSPQTTEQFDVGINVRSEGHFDNMVDALGRKRLDTLGKRLVVKNHFIGAGRTCGGFLG